MRQLPTTILLIGTLLAGPSAFALPVADGDAGARTLSLAVADTSIAASFRVAQSDGLTLNQAVEQVRRQYNGRIVSAETRRSGNREVHHVKVLTEDGKVKTVKVQGRTVGGKG